MASRLPEPDPSAGHAPDADAVDVRNVRAEIDRIENAITAAAEACGYPKAARFGLRLALEEALANAFHHGHRGLGADVPVRVEYRVGRDEIRVAVQDRGPGFDPRSIPDPTLDENLENPAGRGLMLIRAYMTDVTFNEAGNRVDMVLRRPAGT